MLNGPFAFALAAGMAATVNPCGFALLPAYLSAFIGLDEGGSKRSAVMRALVVSLVMTAGFVTVFGLFGAVITKFISGVQEQLPWVTIVIGVGLVVLGIYMLTGRQLVVNIPKLQRGGADGTVLSMYLFGVSYAVASLSCTIGPFLAATSTTFNNENYLSGVAVFVIYGLGMGVVVSVLTLAVALAKDGIVTKFRALLPKMNRIAGGLMLVAGAYVAYYGYYEVRVLIWGQNVEDPIIDAAIDIQNWLQGFVPDTDEAPWYALGGAVIIAVAIVWDRLRRRGRPTVGDRVDESADDEADATAPIPADGVPADGVAANS